MLRILTFGALTLECSDPTLMATQVRLQSLGLLARLAAAGERGVSREKLVGCLWPDKDERAALHSLSQALHRLRTELGDAEFVIGTRILRLDPRHVTSDVGDFEKAHDARDHKRMAELYAGPFLDGIYFSGAPELERWVDGERQRLSALHAGSLRELGRAAVASGRHDEAVQWWRKLLADDPLDTRAATELVHSLAVLGDEVGALREARYHQALVRTELRTEPDPRLVSFIQRHTADGGTSGRAAQEARRGASEGLTADELCARARQSFYTFTRAGFDEGIRYAERAVQVAPDRAEAHVTLGSLYIILSQADPTGDPRAKGVAHCRRASVLDPTLSEAQLFLAWASQLDEQYDSAELHAARGLALDPDGVFANTVAGWVRLNGGLTTGRWAKCVESVPYLRRALGIQPRDAYVPLALGALFTIAGEYDAAFAILERAASVEHWPAGEMRSIGALTLHGHAQLHAGQQAAAQSTLDRAEASYASSPQIYAGYVNALTLCDLGDLDRLDGRYGDAASRYVQARTLIDSSPMIIGSGQVAVRIETRLAAVFRRLRMRAKEALHADAARALTVSRSGYSFGWCWGISEAELHYDWAVYHAECTDRTALLASLRSAGRFGWRETGLIATEPAFAGFEGDGELQRVVDEIRRLPRLTAAGAVDP